MYAISTSRSTAAAPARSVVPRGRRELRRRRERGDQRVGGLHDHRLDRLGLDLVVVGLHRVRDRFGDNGIIDIISSTSAAPRA